jgi:adenylate cyclase
MPKEIERKFLVVGHDWQPSSTGNVIAQGYLCSDERITVRVRVMGEQAFLTIKGALPKMTRPEYEYAIPLNEAEELLELCHKPLIKKVRYSADYEGFSWDVDVFEEENAGLVVAEIELSSEEDVVPLPKWVGQEVTGDARYLNANLIANPYCSW